jgi:hypothetical protein
MLASKHQFKYDFNEMALKFLLITFLLSLVGYTIITKVRLVKYDSR